MVEVLGPVWSICRSRARDSMSMLVCLSVGPSCSKKKEPNQYNKAFSALEAISNDTASARWSVYGLVTAPAQKHATDDAVYTALFLLDVISF